MHFRGKDFKNHWFAVTLPHLYGSFYLFTEMHVLPASLFYSGSQNGAHRLFSGAMV